MHPALCQKVTALGPRGGRARVPFCVGGIKSRGPPCALPSPLGLSSLRSTMSQVARPMPPPPASSQVPECPLQVGETWQSTLGPRRTTIQWWHHCHSVDNMPFLQWIVPAAPAAAIVDRFQLQGVFLLAMQPDTEPVTPPHPTSPTSPHLTPPHPTSPHSSPAHLTPCRYCAPTAMPKSHQLAEIQIEPKTGLIARAYSIPGYGQRCR